MMQAWNRPGACIHGCVFQLYLSAGRWREAASASHYRQVSAETASSAGLSAGRWRWRRWPGLAGFIRYCFPLSAERTPGIIPTCLLQQRLLCGEDLALQRTVSGAGLPPSVNDGDSRQVICRRWPGQCPASPERRRQAESGWCPGGRGGLQLLQKIVGEDLFRWPCRFCAACLR